MNYLVFQQINNFALKYLWLDEIAIFCAEYLGYLLLGVLFVFLIKDFKKYQKIAGEALVSVILARLVIVEIIRFIWYQPRPFVENQVNLLLPYSPSASFPSGHAAFFFALSFLIYFYNKKAGLLLLSASFLIGISRVFCGLHWPADILAGALVGIFSALLVKKISRGRLFL
jgi:undecaprenyl-diphosphatase